MTQSLICNMTMTVVAKVTGVKPRARSQFHNDFVRTSTVTTTTTLVLHSQFDLLLLKERERKP